ncbi:MAG: FkbM family methyltransferase [Pseudomonadota bacterium]
MTLPLRPIAFVLAASNHGSMIVNRNDYRMIDANSGYGVGFQILTKSAFDEGEVNLALALLDSRRKHFGDGVMAIDGGANIGVHTIEWARHMFGWGEVMSFEAQEPVFYALAGNIAINNCLNAHARMAALGKAQGELTIPWADPFVPASFGSLELRKRPGTEYIGQDISYQPDAGTTVPMVNIDSLPFKRLDFFKLDVEGMELEVLHGALDTLRNLRPILLVEVIKSDKAGLETLVMAMGYKVFQMGMNMLAIHRDDPTLAQVTVVDNNLKFATVR